MYELFYYFIIETRKNSMSTKQLMIYLGSVPLLVGVAIIYIYVLQWNIQSPVLFVAFTKVVIRWLSLPMDMMVS